MSFRTSGKLTDERAKTNCPASLKALMRPGRCRDCKSPSFYNMIDRLFSHPTKKIAINAAVTIPATNKLHNMRRYQNAFIAAPLSPPILQA